MDFAEGIGGQNGKKRIGIVTRDLFRGMARSRVRVRDLLQKRAYPKQAYDGSSSDSEAE